MVKHSTLFWEMEQKSILPDFKHSTNPGPSRFDSMCCVGPVHFFKNPTLQLCVSLSFSLLRCYKLIPNINQLPLCQIVTELYEDQQYLQLRSFGGSGESRVNGTAWQSLHNRLVHSLCEDTDGLFPFVFQKKAWQTLKTIVNLPVISPFKKRYSWVQLAGHTGEKNHLHVLLDLLEIFNVVIIITDNY